MVGLGNDNLVYAKVKLDWPWWRIANTGAPTNIKVARNGWVSAHLATARACPLRALAC